MNEQHLASIEERWLKASGGPWTIEDQRRPVGDRGLLYVSEKSIREFQSKSAAGESASLKHIRVNTYKDAFEHGLVQDEDGWLALLEENLRNGATYEQLISSCRFIYCVKAKVLSALRAKEDRKMSTEEQAIASFAVLEQSDEIGRANQADIDFILHAPEDVGALITGMRKANETIDSLTDELVRTKAELDDAKIAAVRAKATVAKLVSVAADIQKLAKG